MKKTITKETATKSNPINIKGFVYLVGAGPGDPGLITVKGRECISRAEVIIYDHLANATLLAYASPTAELIYAGKIGGIHNREQTQINQMILDKAREGKVVTRLKGGDPFVFGRGGEECEELAAAGIPFEIVPGVTAGIGASAYAGIPLTHRDFTTSVAFVTGHERPGKEASGIDWERLSLGSGTIVFYMGIKNLPLIAEKMMVCGRAPETPVALIHWGTRPDQEVLTGTLADIAEKARAAGFKAPAITVVGNVVSLRDKLRWFDNRPLFGKKIMVTRAADQAGEFSRLLTEQGASVLECPTIQIVPPLSYNELDEAIFSLNIFAWLIFTSYNAVVSFFTRLHELGLDSRAIGACRVCAVGPKTAASLTHYGIKADLVPTDYKAEGVVESFRALPIAGLSFLFPKADRARDIIPAELRKLGATVATPVAYRNIIPSTLPTEAVQALEEGHIDVITFTSSSTVTNLATMIGKDKIQTLLQGIVIAAIGPITSQTCRELGLTVHIEPTQYTIPALTEAIVRHFS